MDCVLAEEAAAQYHAPMTAAIRRFFAFTGPEARADIAV